MHFQFFMEIYQSKENNKEYLFQTTIIPTQTTSLILSIPPSSILASSHSS